MDFVVIILMWVGVSYLLYKAVQKQECGSKKAPKKVELCVDYHDWVRPQPMDDLKCGKCGIRFVDQVFKD